ncbi:endogenous retrovirus group PABLB member 1 Env polyprotein-like [Muntiacus reevesi]|uniref:endogenous retrovirus group PABLB member 1 Env polyprotein-like n=1 Tax=Muntiacus reevesi TaxID=9886 RepID=UPI0033079E1B
MPKHRAGSRRGWYARRRRSLTARMESMQIRERNVLPTNQQLHEFVERARHIAADTTNPHISLSYLVLALACAVMNQAFPRAEGNVFLSWAHSYADSHNASACWVCTAMPLSVVNGLPWWVLPISQEDLPAVCEFLKEYKQIHLSLNSLNITALTWCNSKPYDSRIRFNASQSLGTISAAFNRYATSSSKGQVHASRYFGDY